MDQLTDPTDIVLARSKIHDVRQSMSSTGTGGRTGLVECKSATLPPPEL